MFVDSINKLTEPYNLIISLSRTIINIHSKQKHFKYLKFGIAIVTNPLVIYNNSFLYSFVA